MTSPKPATPVDEFLQRLVQEHGQLSRQLKLIGTYIEQHRDHVGLERIQDIADHCGVQPSAVVRFAKHFGFSGFSEMQALFRAGIATQIAPSRSYQNRIREAVARSDHPLDGTSIAQEFVSGAVAGLEELGRHLHELPIDRAVDLLAHAPSLWVAGARRAFPVATYLAYALQHTDKPVQLVDFAGAMHVGQVRGLRRGDVMVAISFAPYAEETMDVVRQARQAGATVIAITDSRVGALAQLADVALVVQESAVFGFRALSSTMALAQCLFIALAYRLELEYKPSGAAAR
ncbi:MurR/RpiR family transcriptional regulator [Hydrogenophaga luteola]|uniref:MurR/RpiR family transcriptional regulator n=1 Tax=Hydrogenophaga luteola TaxID=1591122 RepID=A0ABV7W3U7_9BURK